ncbi:MAG: hypothetical protein KAY08_02680 [Giesbergeria sp.]|nr:hypothetical protein [Giesbergeria sp.]MBP8091720.1 hypothetical protein [Giesbergeria sp.]
MQKPYVGAGRASVMRLANQPALQRFSLSFLPSFGQPPQRPSKKHFLKVFFASLSFGADLRNLHRLHAAHCPVAFSPLSVQRFPQELK